MLFTCEQPEGQARDPGELERIIGQAYEAGRARTQTGTVASYIPELAKADGREFGICARNLAGETIAFGDGSNDISLLRAAGCGVAMENAEPAVKAAADRVTLTNDASGVAAVLEEYL